MPPELCGVALIAIVALALLAWHYRVQRDKAELDADRWYGEWVQAASEVAERAGIDVAERVGMN